MKKIFVVTMALLMCCMFMGCGVKAQLVGTWKSSNTEEESDEGYKFSTKTDITLNINKDGTYSQVIVTTETYTPTIGDPESETVTEKLSGTWYYHDSDKVILKTTNYSVQEGDEDPEVDNNVSYMSAELVLVDDILFVDFGSTIFGSSIFEFTKAK